jgi:hypothetical protein
MRANIRIQLFHNLSYGYCWDLLVNSSTCFDSDFCFDVSFLVCCIPMTGICGSTLILPFPFIFPSSSSPPLLLPLPLSLFLSSVPLRGASTRCVPGASPRRLRCTQCFPPAPKIPVSPGCLSAMSSLPLLVASLFFLMFIPNACHDSFSPVCFLSLQRFSSASSVCPQCLSPVPLLPVFPGCLIIVFTPSPRCLASVFSSLSLVSVLNVPRAPPKCLSPLLIGHIVFPQCPQCLLSVSSISLLPYVSSWPLPSSVQVHKIYVQCLFSMPLVDVLGASPRVFQVSQCLSSEEKQWKGRRAARIRTGDTEEMHQGRHLGH